MGKGERGREGGGVFGGNRKDDMITKGLMKKGDKRERERER